MRDLAASSSPPITTMTHDEILTAMKAGTGVIGSEFEVRDYDGKLIGALPKVAYDPETGIIDGEAGVIDVPGAAQFECNADQEIAGALRLVMLPVEDLRYATNAFEIWPYMIAEFLGPGGQMVTGRWQYGAYPWQPPQRTIEAVGHELWEVAMPDRASILEDAGPGLAGWTIPANSRWRDDIPRLAERGGLDPTLCVLPDSDETTSKFIKWFYTEDRVIKKYEDELAELEGDWASAEAPLGSGAKGIAKQQKTRHALNVRIAWLKNYLGEREIRDGETSLWQIIGDQCEAAGWEKPFFDYQGRLVVRDAVTDLSNVKPSHLYETGSDSIILLPVTDSVDITEVRNRAFGVATGRDIVLDPVQVLLEDISPSHPACESHGRPGAWKDCYIKDDLVGSATALRAATAKRLRDKANASRTLTFSSLLNPSHEVYDFSAMKFAYDPELHNGITFHTRRLSGDFCDHTMTHQHFRTWIYGELPPAQKVDVPPWPAPPDAPSPGAAPLPPAPPWSIQYPAGGPYQPGRLIYRLFSNFSL